MNRKQIVNSSGGGVAATLDSSYYKGCGLRQGIEREFVCAGNGQLHQIGMTNMTNTLDCMHDQQMIVGGNDMDENRKYVLRRLTPTECARLQGFPDWWCDGADGSDSAQYRLWGNGIALPCACDVLGRIAEEMRKDG